MRRDGDGMKSRQIRSRRSDSPQDRFQQTGSITINDFGPNVGSISNQWTYGYKDVADQDYRKTHD